MWTATGWRAGRFNEALAKIERARQLDPLSLRVNADTGRILFSAGRYDEAIEQLRETLEMDPQYLAALFWLGRTYAEKEMYEEALEIFGKASRISGGAPKYIWAMGNVYAATGREAEARGKLEELQELAKHRYVSPDLIRRLRENIQALQASQGSASNLPDGLGSLFTHLGQSPLS